VNVTTTAGYTVTVTNACGCTGTAFHSVQVNAGPNTSITPTGLATYCANTGSVTLTAASGNAYLWSTGATTVAITVAPGHPGNYCVTVTNTNGCSGSSCVILSTSCVIPTIAATPATNISSTYAMANWVQPGCVHGYTLAISRHGQNAWKYYTIAPNTHYTFSGLTHNTCYDWMVQTDCSADNTSIVSGYSAIQQFCTTARLEAGETDGEITAFDVYPNPATNFATVAFTSLSIDNYTIMMVDVTGRTIMNDVYTSTLGNNQVQLNLSGIAKGIYFLVL